MNENFSFSIQAAACSRGDILPLLFAPVGEESPVWRHSFHRSEQPMPLPVGSLLRRKDDQALFQVVGRALLPGAIRPCPLLRAQEDGKAGELSLFQTREGYAAACITLSDKGWTGEREDRSGPRLLELARGVLPLCHEQRFLLPDDPAALRALVLELALGQGYDLILTTGGTGLSPRDLTPEALLPVLTRRLPGFEQKMMRDSLEKTPHAALSRAVAGTAGRTLVLALPGSVKGAGENLEAVLPALPHALEKLKGDPSDCGG